VIVIELQSGGYLSYKASPGNDQIGLPLELPALRDSISIPPLDAHEPLFSVQHRNFRVHTSSIKSKSKDRGGTHTNKSVTSILPAQTTPPSIPRPLPLFNPRTRKIAQPPTPINIQLQQAPHKRPYHLSCLGFDLIQLPFEAFQRLARAGFFIWERREADEFLAFVVREIGLAGGEEGAVER